jgi:hypothetical protein
MTRVVKRRKAPTRTGSRKMQAYLDAGKRDTRLLGPVERHLLAQPPSDRSTLVLHPSEMAKKDWCHRASDFLLSGATQPPEVLGLIRNNIFDAGHGSHHTWQTRFDDMGVLVGRWWCNACTRCAVEFGLRPASCGWCGKAAALEYREVPVRSQEHRIAGHADGWVTGLGADCLIEIKTIGTGTVRMEQPRLLIDADNDLDQVWKNIRRPFPSHYRQGQLYLALAEITYGSTAPTEIVFIYEYKLNGATKEFVVEYDPDSVAHLLDDALDIVYAVEKKRPVRCNNDADGCAQCRPFEAS